MNHKKAIIFDFDGTIADSMDIEAQCMVDAIHQYGHEEVTTKNIYDHFGPSEDGIIKRIVGEDNFAEAWCFFLEDYVRMQNDKMKIFPGIEDLLVLLNTKQDAQIILVTGRSQDTLDISLEFLKISPYFKKTYSGSPLGINKEDNIKKVLEDFHLSKGDIVYVGDTLADIHSMKHADVDIISVSYSSDKETILQLEKENPGNVVHSVKELTEKILTLID